MSSFLDINIVCAFHWPGDKIYGRINVDPVQNLGNSFDLNVEKVFLCSGTDGYIPKYDPDNLEFGCVAESPNLQYTFKILVSCFYITSNWQMKYVWNVLLCTGLITCNSEAITAICGRWHANVAFWREINMFMLLIVQFRQNFENTRYHFIYSNTNKYPHFS